MLDGTETLLTDEMIAPPEAEVVETPEVASEVEVEIETPEAPAEEAAEEVAEETPEETVEETPEEAETPEDPEPISFDAEIALDDLNTQAATILDKYELPQEVQAVLNAYKQKAEVTPLAEFADYGEPDAIKTVLERQAYLTTAREDGGKIRPNTDKFVESLDPDRAAWLAHDLSARPSSKYAGYSQFEEQIINNFAVEGDTVQGVLDRYHAFVDAMRTNTLPSSGMPEFIPQNLKEAYFQLTQEERDDIKDLDIELDPTDIRRHVARLELMQKGINSERAEIQRAEQERQAAHQSFVAKVEKDQTDFFTAFRNVQAKNLAEKVTFSDDPKMNAFQANQVISLMSQAFDDGDIGEFARQSLTNAGIEFDHAKAQSLLKDLELAIINKNEHERKRDANGNPLNQVELNKAISELTNVGRKWTQFAESTLDQVARVTSTGKQEDVKKAAEKIKVAPKARPVPQGTPSATKRTTVSKNPHPYGTGAYFEWQANELMAAQKAA